MAEIVWLASYPKSGNTWLRVLLENYRLAGVKPADINSLGLTSAAYSTAHFDTWSGLEVSALDPKVVERARPQLFRILARASPENLYLKVHDAWHRTDQGEPLYPEDVTRGVVYIARNPLDLPASMASYYGIDVRSAVERLCRGAWMLGKRNSSNDGMFLQSVLTWSEHARSWLDDSGLQLLLVRYEDLLADTKKVFTEVVRFCGLPIEPSLLERAVGFSSFSELALQEAATGFRERQRQTLGPFFRRGVAGCWRDDLTEDEVRTIVDCHGPMMRRLGYLEERGTVPENSR